MNNVYCDNCGDLIPERVLVGDDPSDPLSWVDGRVYVEALPVDVESAEAGESAVLCLACAETVLS